MDVRMELCRVLITEYGDQQMIFLREVDGERRFPILIGLHEALAIDRRLKGQRTPRPMTHDLLSCVIEALGARVDRIVINDLRNHTFIATLHIEQDGRKLTVDSRPSDAIALGVAMDTPIFVAEKVLDELAKPPHSKEDRLQLLRDRLEALERLIADLRERLDDPSFRSGTTDAQIQQLEDQLDTLQTEQDAIQRVLDKLG